MDEEAKEVHEEEIEVEDHHAPEVEEEIVDANSEAEEEEHNECQEEEAADKPTEAKNEDDVIENEDDFKVDVLAFVEKTDHLDRETVESLLGDIVCMSLMKGALMGASEDEIAAKLAEVKAPLASLVYPSAP